MQKNSFRNTQVTTVDAIRDEARSLVLLLGEGRPAGDTYERMCWRAAMAAGLPFARTWAYFYRKIKRPPADEMDALRARWTDVQRRKRLAEFEDGIEKFNATGASEAERRAEALRPVNGGSGATRTQAPSLFG